VLDDFGHNDALDKDDFIHMIKVMDVIIALHTSCVVWLSGGEQKQHSNTPLPVSCL